MQPFRIGIAEPVLEEVDLHDGRLFLLPNDRAAGLLDVRCGGVLRVFGRLLRFGGRRMKVELPVTDETGVDEMVTRVNGLMHGRCHYRKFRHSVGDSGWWYGLLPNARWRRLEQKCPQALDQLFVEIDPSAFEPAWLCDPRPWLSPTADA